MEGSGDDPVDSDPDPAINEVSDVTETLGMESVDKDTMEEMEKDDEEAMAEMEINDQNGDDIADGNMDEDEENKKDKDPEYTPQKDPKCQKCARPIYKERHEEYCRACKEASGDNVTEEVSMAAEDVKKKKQCEKCYRKGFMKKNMEFCDMECKKEEIEDTVDGVELEVKVKETTLQLNIPTSKCEKCSRKGFMKKNKEFCDTECKKKEIADTIEVEELEVEEVEEVEETTSQLNLPTSEAEQEEEEATTIPSPAERKGSKERKRKCGKCSKKGFRKKNKEFCNSDCKDMGEKENTSGKNTKQHGKHHQSKNKNKMKGNKNMKKGKKDILKEEEKIEEKLGPLENLIKYLIKRNTYKKNH